MLAFYRARMYTPEFRRVRNGSSILQALLSPPTMNGHMMTLVTDTRHLADFCTRQRGQPWVAVDTEFMRDSTYWTKLCVVQLASPKEEAVIDVLAENMDLQPLAELLDSPNIVKIFHAGRQDLEVFLKIFGRLPRKIFDTQIAAMACGFEEQVSYQHLIFTICQVKLNKSKRFSNWQRRPLSEQQILYARNDVHYLGQAYLHLSSYLQKHNRTQWLDEEMETLCDPRRYNCDPKEAWKRLKPQSRAASYMTACKLLAEFREAQAQKKDLPRNWVLRDQQLHALATHLPRTSKEMLSLRGFGRRPLPTQIAVEVCKIVEKVRHLPNLADSFAPSRSFARDVAVPPLLEALRRSKSNEHAVATRLLASTDDLKEIVLHGSKANTPALRGWRYDLFGRAALDLCAGRIAMTLRNGKTTIVSRQTTAIEPNAHASRTPHPPPTQKDSST